MDKDNSGIDLAKEIKNITSAPILFITSQTQNDIIQDVIKTEPAGYLMKPVDPAELKVNIELVLLQKDNPQDKENEKSKQSSEFLTVRTGKKLRLLQFKDIKLIKVEVKNHVTLVDNNDKEFVIRDSLKNILAHVLPDYFTRTHHSYGVNIEYIMLIDEHEQMIHLKTNDSIPIGKGFKKIVYEMMNIKS